jgi:hypothetical protein
MQIEDILKKYKITIFEKDIVYFRAKEPKYIIICFTAMHENRFDRINWFYNNEQWEDTSYLFLQDNSFHYYVGTDKVNDFLRYRKVIEYFFMQDKYFKKNTITLGSSMGGYAALYYAITFGFKGAITAMPQLDKESIKLHNFQNWQRLINECGDKWIDIGKLIEQKEKLPLIYIEYGNYEADKQAVIKFINLLKERKSFYILRHTDKDDHTMLFEKENIFSTIQYFKSLRNEN